MNPNSDTPTPNEIHDCAVAHGWYEGIDTENLSIDFIPSKLALIHSEVSEALEAYRDGYDDCRLEHFGEEMADVVIRVFDLCAFLGIDILDVIRQKHEVNLKRPYKHGGKRI